MKVPRYIAFQTLYCFALHILKCHDPGVDFHVYREVGIKVHLSTGPLHQLSTFVILWKQIFSQVFCSVILVTDDVLCKATCSVGTGMAVAGVAASQREGRGQCGTDEGEELGRSWL